MKEMLRPGLASLVVVVALRLFSSATLQSWFRYLVPSALLVIVVHYVLAPALNTSARLFRMYRVAKPIPGPSPMPILRRFWSVEKVSFSDVSDVLQEVLQNHGPTMKFWSGPCLFVVIMHPDDFEYVMTSKKLANKSIVYGKLQQFQGNGLLNLSGDVWRRHRKIITPFLHSDLLKEFVDVFDRKAELMVKRLEPLVDAGTYNLYPYVALATSDMICETVLSTNMDTQDNEEREFVDGISQAMKLLMYRVFYPWFLNDALFTLSKYHKHYERLVGVFNSFTERMISRKRREAKVADGQGDEAHFRKRRTFLDMMISSPEGSALTDTEIRDETKTLVTVASGGSVDVLGFTLLCLSLRQDVQDKCVEELERIYGDDPGRPITTEDVQHMEYIERVIRETLRMFPSIPLFARSVEEDLDLPSGYKVPAGAQLVMYNLWPHRSAEFFPDPTHFDPDRFLLDRQSGRHPFSYVPFSGGVRNCIGQRYALLQLKTTVARLLRHYRLLPSDAPGSPVAVEHIKLNISVTLSARGGYRMRLQRRLRHQTGAH